jgi:FkbM family methyltransferase
MSKRIIGKCLARMGIDGLVRSAYYRLFGARITRTVSASNHSCTFHCPTPMLSDSVASLAKEREAMEWFLSHIHPGGTVWDVGANIGLWTIFAAKAVGSAGRIVAFDPFQDALAVLGANVELNNVRNVAIRAEALGASDGEALLYPARAGVMSTSALAPRSGRFGTRDAPVRAPIRSGRSLVEEGAAPLPDAMKVDVEGAEQLVLDGLSSSIWEKLKVVMIEVHPDFLPSLGGTVEGVRSILENHGFRIQCEYRRRDTLHWPCLRSEASE